MRGEAAAAGLLGALLLAAPSPGSASSLQERLGHPATARLLVIHADDLGMAYAVNRASFLALERGWITSASILVPCPWFPEVAVFAREHPEADLGIHLALNSEWTGLRWGPVGPVDEVPSLLDPDGFFPLLETTVAERAKVAEVERELRAQITRAQRAGIRLTHLDSHMGALFQTPELLSAYLGLGREFDLPLLVERDGVRGGAMARAGANAADAALVDRVLSISPGVAPGDWLEAYKKLLKPLPPGVYQLIVHLAYDDDEMRGATWDHPDWGAAWRRSDLDLVKSEAFREFLRDEGFVLVGWRDLDKARRTR